MNQESKASSAADALSLEIYESALCLSFPER